MNENIKTIVIIICVINLVTLVIIGLYNFISIDSNNNEIIKTTVKNNTKKKITNIDEFYNNEITNKYKDIRKLDMNYNIEQAQKDNCFVIGAMVHNDNLYSEFMNNYSKKISAFIRVAQTTAEGDIYLIDLLYDSNNDIIYFIKDDRRDKFSREEDRIINFKSYKKTGIWKYQNSEYWVVYNKDLPDGDIAQYSINPDELFIITTIN